jgi:hypothetical protein
LPSSSLSTASERRLLATAILHQVGHGCRWCHVLYQVCFRSCFPSVSSVCYVCCNGYVRMLQVYVSSVSCVCLSCFICMFHVFSSVCFILMLQKDLMLHMLQWLHTYVSSVCSTCFICLDVCCKCMFQMFQAHVSCVLSRCCNDYTSMFQ